MRFATFMLADAVGAILAHSVVTTDGTLKKGRVLTADDVARLARAGMQSVIAAKLEPGDVAEDLAAGRIASALGGTGIRIAAPFTGRCNVYATAAGIARFDAERLSAVNDIDERITVATVAANERVAAGQMIATVKIIPFSVPEAELARAEHAARLVPLSVAPFRAQRAGLILTTFASTKPTLLDKRRRAIEERVTALGSSLARATNVAHEADAVAAELARMRNEGLSPLLVFAASAIVDRADVVPAALVAAGGRIERLGMPVDPGNLMLLGNLDATPVIGIPSCAASPKLNGFDWVLERVLAGLRVTTSEIAAMGAGGLLKEIATRPQPRDDKVAASDMRAAPRIACIVLAAGRSTRMGTNKLLEAYAGRPLVHHVVTAAKASACHRVVVVTGHQSDLVRDALRDLDVTFVHNSGFADGLATSLRVGLTMLGADSDGVIVALGDMPEITPTHFDRLIAAFAPNDGRSIVVPTVGGKRGNPVLWARRYFTEMAEVEGDTGAKHLIGRYADDVTEVAIENAAVLTDIDTPEALAALRARG